MKKVIKVLMCFLLPMLVIVFSCKPADPCASVVCQNSGTCGGNGLCACPAGYTGNFCEKQVIPRAIVIHSITVTKFPATKDNGAGWDLTSGPDIYVKVYEGNVNLLWDSPTYFPDAVNTQTYKFTPATPIRLTDATKMYIIELNDYDSVTLSERISVAGILFGSDAKDLPAKMLLNANCATCPVSFELAVTYEL
jgi:hypothetical protein